MYKRRKDTDTQHQKSERNQAKDGGEEKYETKIYSISASSGKL